MLIRHHRRDLDVAIGNRSTRSMSPIGTLTGDCLDVEELTAALHERPAGQGIIDTVEQWLRRKQGARTSFDDLYDRMLQANPQLEGLCRGRLTEVIREGAQLLAEEQGWSADDLAPRMLAATVASVISELTHRSQPGDLDRAMVFIRAAAATLR